MDKINKGKLLFLTTWLTFGGAEMQVYRLAVAMKLRSWDVKVVSIRSPQALLRELESAGIKVYSLDTPKGSFTPKTLFSLISILKKEKPNIIHSHMVHANILARVVRLFLPIPIICTAHSIYEGGVMRDWWYRLTDCLCDLTTQVSQTGLNKYILKRMVNPKKAKFIPNGVDINVFHKDTDIRRKLRILLNVQGCFVWLAIGRLEREKDYYNMIKAFRIIRENDLAFMLLIVGTGTLRNKLESFVEETGLSKNIKFLGVRQDIQNLMNAADGYVMSSLWEGLPFVLLEAGACELPVVTTNVGGNKEALLDRETGFLVPSENPEELANAMIKVMNLSAGEREQMGKSGRDFIKNKYQLDDVVNIWECLYRELSKHK